MTPSDSSVISLCQTALCSTVLWLWWADCAEGSRGNPLFSGLLLIARKILPCSVWWKQSFSPVSVNISLVYRSLQPGRVCLATVIHEEQQSAAVHTKWLGIITITNDHLKVFLCYIKIHLLNGLLVLQYNTQKDKVVSNCQVNLSCFFPEKKICSVFLFLISVFFVSTTAEDTRLMPGRHPVWTRKWVMREREREREREMHR